MHIENPRVPLGSVHIGNPPGPKVYAVITSNVNTNQVNDSNAQFRSFNYYLLST